MNIFFITFISLLYLIRSFHFINRLHSTKYLKHNLNLTLIDNEQKENIQKQHICGFDECGFDMTVEYVGDFNVTKLDNFVKNLKKIKLIKILEDNNVSIFTKLELINQYFPTNHSTILYNNHLYDNHLFQDFLLFGLD
jgi:hypothetical protein